MRRIAASLSCRNLILAVVSTLAVSLFHQAKVEFALGRQRFARPGFLMLIRICHLQLPKGQVLQPLLEPDRLCVAPHAWAAGTRDTGLSR